jgi:hypothetical protein
MAKPDLRTPAPVGPSDSSDSASDLIGAEDWRGEHNPSGAGPRGLDAETDAEGTGERAGVGSEVADDGADVAPDRIIGLDLPSVPDGIDREDAMLDDKERSRDRSKSSDEDAS